MLAATAMNLAEEPAIANISLFKKLSSWKNQRWFKKDLITATDLSTVEKWPIKKELLVQSLQITASSLVVFLTMVNNYKPEVYCLGTMSISAYLWQQFYDLPAPAKDSKTKIALASVGFCSLIQFLGELPQSWLCGIITLQLVSYAVAATAAILNCATQSCILSIEKKASPILKEHSALEVASQEMLDALSSHGQGCALLFLATKGRSLDENENNDTPS